MGTEWFNTGNQTDHRSNYEFKTVILQIPSWTHQFQQSSLWWGKKVGLTHKSDSLCNRITGLAQNPTILVIREDAIPLLPGYFFHDAYVLKVLDGTVHCR